MRVLISGAGVAGTVVAYWLAESGFAVTVVERAGSLRASGHAVDLWGSAVDVIERMGLLNAVLASRTANDTGIVVDSEGRTAQIDLERVGASIAPRQVEIMRGTLVELLHNRSSDRVRYVYADAIRALEIHSRGVSVTFDNAETDTFDVVIGADGIHSAVRREAFGPENRYRRDLGGYLAGFSIPNYLELTGTIARFVAAHRTAVISPIRGTDRANVSFLFSSSAQGVAELPTHQQRAILRERFANDGWELPRLLALLGESTDFYFDSVSQIVMDSWSTDRVALIGDAAFSPGPAVGGGTTAAVISGYLLARELTTTPNDIPGAFQRYGSAISGMVSASREVGPGLFAAIVPDSESRARVVVPATRLIERLPAWLARRLVLPGKPARALRTVASTPID